MGLSTHLVTVAINIVSYTLPSSNFCVSIRCSTFVSGKFQTTFPDCFRILAKFVLTTYTNRVIIEELKFVTDELGHAEDPAWSHGATADQVHDVALAFESFAAGTSFISVDAAVNALLWEIPPPLGFNLGLGCFEREQHARAAQRMIRAEFNLILRRRFTEEAAKKLQNATVKSYQRLIREFMSGEWAWPQQRFVNGVMYREAMLVFLCWRKPSLIPERVLIQRVTVLEEAYLMACALTVRDFLWSLVAQRKCDELGHHVRELFRLRKWARADRHRIRLSAFYTSARAELLARAEQDGTDPSEIFFPPAASISIMLEPFTGPIDQRVHLHYMAAHFDANAQSLGNTAIPRPSQGLEAFRKRATKQGVVVRFVHPEAQPRRPVVFQADLRECRWGGWQVLFHIN